MFRPNEIKWNQGRLVRFDRVAISPIFADKQEQRVDGGIHREFVMGSGEMDEQESTDFLPRVWASLAPHSADASLHCLCTDWRHWASFWQPAYEAYDELKNVCVWVKDKCGMGSLYWSQHELAFVFKKGWECYRN